MSAQAYIQWADVPKSLIESSRQHIDEPTKAQIVAFDGCPLCGEISQTSEKVLQVEYVFPRHRDLRDSLVDWFMHHGISFTVVV
ncbi:phage portal protein [Paraburkholderia sp. 2C]